MASTQTGSSVRIVAGPSKFDLMLALFEGKRVEFTFEGMGKKPVIVNQIGIEDGSRESWLVWGGIIIADKPLMPFSGYFQTVRRQGTAKFL